MSGTHKMVNSNKTISHIADIDVKSIIVKIQQIENNLNHISLEIYVADFNFKTFMNKLDCQKNVLMKIETILRKNCLLTTKDVLQKISKIFHIIADLKNKVNDIKNMNKLCEIIITNVNNTHLQFAKDNDFYKNYKNGNYNSNQLNNIIKEKRLMLTNIGHIQNIILSDLDKVKQYIFINPQFVEAVNNSIDRIAGNTDFSLKMLNKLVEVYKEIKYKEFVKKSKTFSNLSINELKHVSGQLWMPNKVLGKNDKTKSNYKSASSYLENKDSDSWFGINKITNIVTHIPSTVKADDKMTLQYKKFVGWNNKYCMDCNVYKRYQSMESVNKMYVEYTDNPKLEEIKNKEIEIKDVIKPFSNFKKKFKKAAKSKTIKFDESKKSCKFIMTTLNNKITYARHCGNLCEPKLDFCKFHQSEEKQKDEFDYFAENLCEHVITQKSKGKGSDVIVDRKGMKCNNFTFGSLNIKYCRVHAKSHELEELANKVTELRTFKIRVYPTLAQRVNGNKYFGSARKTYNMCVKDDAYDYMTEDQARKKYVIDVEKLGKEYEFLKKIPKEIREFEVSQYYTNVKNALDMYETKQERNEWNSQNLLKYKKKQITKPKITYKMKNDAQSLHISKSTINVKNNKISFYKGTFGKDGFRIKDRLLKINKKTNKMRDNKLNDIFKTGINHDMTLIKTVTGKYYLCVSTDNEIKQKKSNVKTVAIDVGARTPFVSYSENECYEFGAHMSGALNMMIDERDKLRKIYGAEIGKKQKGQGNEEQYEKSKKKYLLHVQKIKNRIEDFHNKVITKLVKEYSIILIPKLNVKKIMERLDVHKTTKKQFSILSHSLFLKRLENKCKQEGVILKIVNEDMTTQTCGNCFSTYKFKEEIYECSKCGLKIGRDINSARNIYIREICKMVEFTKYIRSIL